MACTSWELSTPLFPSLRTPPSLWYDLGGGGSARIKDDSGYIRARAGSCHVNISGEGWIFSRCFLDCVALRPKFFYGVYELSYLFGPLLYIIIPLHASVTYVLTYKTLCGFFFFF